MQLSVLFPVIISLLLSPIASQPTRSADTDARARELAALFNKKKDKVKDRRGIHIEIHINIISEPVVKPTSEYSGDYGADDTFRLHLDVAADGKVTGRGTEPGFGNEERSFTLRDARIDGALVTGTKVYDNGAAENSRASSSVVPSRAICRTRIKCSLASVLCSIRPNAAVTTATRSTNSSTKRGSRTVDLSICT